ncbi:hypothetical protein [uncultured Halomonas sp.]|uniref:hypothetical protein n=1 Tax=uncultured Halomonas sp. TaxID=173971 RepID=UPI002607DDEE|nr:hypothetical protein [uncultured Halomonas sp.]
MIYGQRPESMTPEEWTIETQCRFVARKMREGRNRSARLAIFEEWQRKLPAITKERVAEIWKQGVPMPKGRSAA